MLTTKEKGAATTQNAQINLMLIYPDDERGDQPRLVSHNNPFDRDCHVTTRDLSSKKPCICAKCRIERDCPQLIMVPVCQNCFDNETRRVEQNHRERRWGIRS